MARTIRIAVLVLLVGLLVWKQPWRVFTDGLSEGTEAPELAIRHWYADGETRLVDLTLLKGKPVFIEFWSMQCGPCVEKLPAIQKLHETYGPKGLQVLGVHVALRGAGAPDFKRLHAFADSKGLTFPIGYDTKAETWKAYEYESVPHGVLIDKQGRVVWSGSLAVFDVEDDIQELLAQ